MEDCCWKGCRRYSPYTQLEGSSKEDRRLEVGDREGHGPKTGRSIIDEDMVGSSKNTPLISVGIKRITAQYGSINLCDFFKVRPC
jgi:hypothetical protein